MERLKKLGSSLLALSALVVLPAGRVVAAGTPQEVLTEDVIAQVYGVRCRVAVDDGRPVIRYDAPLTREAVSERHEGSAGRPDGLACPRARSG